MGIESTCLYCPGLAGSREHPLPAAFGEFVNAPVLPKRICRKCNGDRLGKLDEQLSRCGPEGFLRRFYGVAGRSTHEEVNPFYRGSAGGRPLLMKSHDEKLGLEILLEQAGGVTLAARQLILVKNGRPHHIPIREGTTPEQLREAIERLGVSTPESGQIVCSQEDRDWVLALLQSVWPSANLVQAGETSGVYGGATVGVTLTDRYFRAVAKIGFHYFLTQFPSYSGHESGFAELKGYILDEQGPVECANVFIGKRQLPLMGAFVAQGARPKGWKAHVLCAEVKDSACLAHVQLFLSEDWPAPTYTIRLGVAPRAANQGTGHLYLYDESGRSDRFVGEAHRLTCTTTDLPAKPLLPAIG